MDKGKIYILITLIVTVFIVLLFIHPMPSPPPESKPSGIRITRIEYGNLETRKMPHHPSWFPQYQWEIRLYIFNHNEAKNVTFSNLVSQYENRYITKTIFIEEGEAGYITLYTGWQNYGNTNGLTLPPNWEDIILYSDCYPRRGVLVVVRGIRDFLIYTGNSFPSEPLF